MGHCDAGAVKRAVAMCSCVFTDWSPFTAFPVNQVRGFSFHPFPPDVPIIGQSTIGENGVLFDGFHGHGVGFVRSTGRHAEKTSLSVDCPETSVRCHFHPGNIVTDTLCFPAGDRRLYHGQIGLAASRGKSSGDMVLTAFRIGKPQDNHVLSHPAFAFGDCGAETQGQAFFPQESVAAITGTIRPDGILIGEMTDIFLFHRSARPGSVLLSFFQWSSDRVETLNKILTFVEEVNHFPADTCHDVHIADDIRTIGNLTAIFDQENRPVPWRRG